MARGRVLSRNSLVIKELRLWGGGPLVTRLVLGSYVSLPIFHVFTVCACYRV